MMWEDLYKFFYVQTNSALCYTSIKCYFIQSFMQKSLAKEIISSPVFLVLTLLKIKLHCLLSATSAHCDMFTLILVARSNYYY